jgi:hypothetical protein
VRISQDNQAAGWLNNDCRVHNYLCIAMIKNDSVILFLFHSFIGAFTSVPEVG